MQSATRVALRGMCATVALARVSARRVRAMHASPWSSTTSTGSNGGMAVGAGSHADFAPQRKDPPPMDKSALHAEVQALVRSHPVVLFMKGTPSKPQCGFSQRVVQLLRAAGADIHGVDILSNNALRVYMKEFSEWPTFPQLYIAGEFVGGCDIATQMSTSGELQKLLAAAKAGASQKKA